MITVASASGSARAPARQASSSATNSSIDGKRSRRLLRHRAPQRRVEPQRHVGPDARHARRRLVDVLHRDRDEVVARERRLARRAARRGRRRASRRRCARRRAGRSPARARCSRSSRARSRSASGRARRPASGRSRSRSPSTSPFAVQQHVLRLHVAVDEAVRVRERERARRSRSPSSSAARTGSRPLALDQLLQVLAVDVLEDDELPAVAPRRGRSP